MHYLIHTLRFPPDDLTKLYRGPAKIRALYYGSIDVEIEERTRLANQRAKAANKK